MLDRKQKRFRFRVVVPAYPAFNIYSNIAAMTTSLGPVYVATNVNKMPNWDAEVIDENNLRLHGPKSQSGGADHALLQEERPADIVGLYGGLTSTIPRLYSVGRFYKEQGAITIAGGQHFVGDNIRDALVSGIDYIVLGEGEETVPELIAAIQGKGDIAQVKGIAYRQDGKVVSTAYREPLRDFEKLPFPDFSLVRYARLKVYPVERIRGCGMDCEFCTVKGEPRAAPAGRLLEQIQRLVETRNAKHFFIVDDLFGQYRAETIEFCERIKVYQNRIGQRLDFTAQIRLDKARDRQLLLAMRQANINMLCIGFESPIAEELKAMNKHIQPQEMLALTKIFHQFGFLVHGMFIFGYPLETSGSFSMTAPERVKRYKTFIRQARLDTIQILLPVPLPGTQLSERLRRENRIYDIRDVGWEYYDGNFPIFEPDAPLTAEELQAAQRKLMAGFYRFSYVFRIGLNVLAFPALVLFFYDLRRGWQQWYRSWRNDLIRFIGWNIVKEWNWHFK
ncbi:MAG: B12-binding domain-containing radical SAM protein [Candidatus Omnitrophica bacterium]|nr:B12-binding domain-containing radical SAM protein [Candidatus Omnitrophota bacterium]